MDKADLVAYCTAKPGVTEDYPFGPDTQVFKVMGKLFALLGTAPDDVTVNLKCDPDHALFLRNAYPDDVKPGYHMNKQHWNTVNFASGTIPDDELLDMVNESYDLVVNTLKKADREKLKGL